MCIRDSKYSSGMLFSKLRFSRGRFEIRCKVPLSTSDWIWPAFWLYGDGPNCPEIDVMEIVHDRSNMYHNGLHMHTGDCRGEHASEGDTHELMELSNDFHVFRADWDKWFINFYVDDMLLHRSCRIYDLLDRPVSSCYIPAGIYIQNQAFPAQDEYMALTVGLGIHNSGPNDSVGPGPPVPNIPCALEIDYIRVYQR